MSMFGVQLDISCEEIINRMKLKFGKLYGGFEIREFLLYSKKITKLNNYLNIEELEKVLNQINIFFQKSDLQILILKYKDDIYPDYLNIEKFYFSMKVPLNNRRNNLVLKLFNTLDRENNGIISMDSLINLYDFNKHDLIKYKKINLDSFILRFKNLFLTENIDFKCFLDVFVDISTTISSDKMFANMFKDIYNIEEDKEIKATKEQFQEAISNIRKKLIISTNNIEDEFILKKIVLKYNLSRDGYLSECGLDKILTELNNPVSKPILLEIMNNFEKNSDGKIHYDDLERFLLYNPYN